MPKIVDHDARRRELAEAVWRVIARDGVDAVSVRVVAAESGWSTGALRYYFTTRAELLAFACEQVIDRVSERIARITPTEDARAWARAALSETMPLDPRRHTEATIAFSFVALGLSDPELARVQRRHFRSMRELCERAVAALESRPSPAAARTRRAAHLHAVVDGLALQGLAGFLTPEQMSAGLDACLDETN
ncbi:TetR/AcrR family transcriptional regulator [Nocardia pseudobrasiliensis]|uniref:TetR family transcriptional regulator n=1 Tax=Nocardia pseudobrasiliensis TaxID=45979 RepID=A0A370IEH7_9NOCA|nr:TetR/AcrR family transcriptional regulator [Nocardia pseudobrasiliensis]RDI69125.1 TetR family transcriptional regulator [Nocardia pseudobrasiliensis]